jgi:tetratricopeptide (TPR) repeat protein
VGLTGKELYEQGVARERAGDLPGAFEAFRMSAKSDPRIAAPYVGLARILTRNHQRTEAIACLERAARCEPSSVAIRSLLGRTFLIDGQPDQAKIHFDAARTLAPDDPGAAIGLAGALEDLGDKAAAANIYRKLLEQRPGHAEAMAGLLGVAEADSLENILGDAAAILHAAPASDAALIGYALGKALTKAGHHDRAFSAWSSANLARREAAGGFDRSAFDARIDRLIQIFSPDFFAARRTWGNASEWPVFVVGLPRSGTTLTEQVLAGHPRVFGAGELDLLTDLATGTPARLGRTGPSWPETAPLLRQTHVASIARDHLARLSVLTKEPALRIIDKQPLNFWHLGLVALTFPNARIIHCTRDIRDNGLSIFAENFTPEQRWATDLSDIAHYWRGYRRLIDHWRNSTTLEIVDNNYETMVEDLEPASRRLVAFLGLDWDESCLGFHASNRAVQTPSRWQVRQPVYQTSSGRWHLHEHRIGPLCEAAGDIRQ